MHTEQDRFSNILGEDYNLFNKAVPHHDEFQDKIGEIIKEYSKSLKAETLMVVEGGSGTGLTTLRILNADERIKVLGIDNEEKTISQAQQILEDYRGRVQLQKSDLIEALYTIPDRTVDIFASAWVLHNLVPSYRATLFPEIARILKSGGLFVNGDKCAQNDKDEHQRDLQRQLEAFNVFDELGRTDLKEKWIEHYHEDEKIKLTEEEQTLALGNLGFTNISVAYRNGMEAIITAIR